MRTPGQIIGAAVTGAAIGAAGGAALGSGFSIGAGYGALIAAAVVGAGSATADATRRPGREQPFLWRVVVGSQLAALLGWAIDLVTGDIHHALIGGALGLLFGALGVRPSKVVLGVVVGVAVGLAVEGWRPETHFAVTAAAMLVVYRLIAWVIFHRAAQMMLMGERVPTAEIEYVVPFAASHRYVGTDYLKEYADLTGADFVRSPADIGIIADLGELAGPRFDPAAAHPLIVEFYEHTSRFRLSIVPEWRWWMRPAYLLYRTAIARPLGQANAPFAMEEVQRGVVSWIDTIDVDHDGTVDFRAWVRAYEATGEPLYLGIYTVLRHEGIGYVSVGFPLPTANFTATLLPTANRGNGLLLKSQTDLPFPGHYLSVVEEDRLSVIRLDSFHEEIDVYVEEGELKTDHRFSLWGVTFLTLRYEISRKS